MSHADPHPLPEANTVAYPLVQWLVRHGVGHREWAAMLKPMFFAAALDQAEQQGHSTNDSALSLRSGLHRKDVRALREAHQHDIGQLREATQAMGKPSPAARVLAQWRAKDWPTHMAFDGPGPSFQALVASVSQDFHHRAVLDELVRLGQAETSEGQVRLHANGMAIAPQTREARQLLAGSVADHLQAGVNNLVAPDQPPCLDQSLFADGLSAESVQALHALARDLWSHTVLPALFDAANQYCQQDQNTPSSSERFRCGMFSFSASREVQGNPS